jgi:aromatic-amino-acid transaminase
LISELVLGADSVLIRERRAGATQTPGGTGALRLAPTSSPTACRAVACG